MVEGRVEREDRVAEAVVRNDAATAMVREDARGELPVFRPVVSSWSIPEFCLTQMLTIKRVSLETAAMSG